MIVVIVLTVGFRQPGREYRIHFYFSLLSHITEYCPSPQRKLTRETSQNYHIDGSEVLSES